MSPTKIVYLRGAGSQVPLSDLAITEPAINTSPAAKMCLTCLCLMWEDASQRQYAPREVCDGLRYVVRTGGAWRTRRGTPGSGDRAGYDGYKRTEGSKVHAVVDTPDHPLALHVTPADEQERDQAESWPKGAQDVTNENVTAPYADQGYTGHAVAADAKAHGMDSVVVGLKEARRGFVLLPER